MNADVAPALQFFIVTFVSVTSASASRNIPPPILCLKLAPSIVRSFTLTPFAPEVPAVSFASPSKSNVNVLVPSDFTVCPLPRIVTFFSFTTSVAPDTPSTSNIAEPSAEISFERLIVSPSFAVAAAVLNSFQFVTFVTVGTSSIGNLKLESKAFCKIKATSTESITAFPFTSATSGLKPCTSLGLST